MRSATPYAMICTLLFCASVTQAQILEEALQCLKEGSGALNKTLVSNVGVKYFLVRPTYFSRERIKSQYLAASIQEKARLLYLARRNDPCAIPFNFLKRQVRDERLSDHERYLCYQVYAQVAQYYGASVDRLPRLTLTTSEKSALDELLNEDVDYVGKSGDLGARAREVYQWISGLCREERVNLGNRGFACFNPNELYVRTIMRQERRAAKDILDLVEAGVLKSEISWNVALFAARFGGDRARALGFGRANIVAACRGDGVPGVVAVIGDFGEEGDIPLIESTITTIGDPKVKRILTRVVGKIRGRADQKVQERLTELLKKKIGESGK